MKVSFPILIKLCEFIDPTSIDGYSIDYTKIEKTYKFKAKLGLSLNIRHFYDLVFENPQDEILFILKYSDILDNNIKR